MDVFNRGEAENQRDINYAAVMVINIKAFQFNENRHRRRNNVDE